MTRALTTLCTAFVFVMTVCASTEAGTGEPKRWTRKVPRNSDVIYKVKYLAEKDEAEFAVIGDGSTDIDIIVYDESGTVIVSDTRTTDLALVRWQCRKTQIYKIVVRNLGGEENVCQMGHN